MTKNEYLHPKDIKEVILGDKELSIDEVIAVARYSAKASFTESYCNRVRTSRALIEKFLEEERAIYGVTTGFGSNVTKNISLEDAETLQKNIIRSHGACSMIPLKFYRILPQKITGTRANPCTHLTKQIRLSQN